MPLFNVYNYHSQIKPHIPYRFNCDIWPYDPANNLRDNYPENKILSYAIKKISQPVFKINLENTRKLFGNTQYTIPVFNFAETELEITFEETDDMAVYKFLCNQSNGAFGTYMRSAVSSLINIEIEQFDYTMKRTVDRKHYIVELKSFSQPQFNNNGYGAPIEITARFYVMYVYDNPLDQEVDDSAVKLKYKDQGIDRDMLETPDFTKQYKKAKDIEERFKKEQKSPAPALKTNRKNKKVEQEKTKIQEELEKQKKINQEAVLEGFKTVFDDSESLLKIIEAARKNYEAATVGVDADLYQKQAAGEEFRKKFNKLSTEEKKIALIALAFGIDINDDISDEEFKKLGELTKKKIFNKDNLNTIGESLKTELELQNKLNNLNYGAQPITGEQSRKYTKERKDKNTGEIIITHHYITTESSTFTYTMDDGTQINIVRRDVIESSQNKAGFNQEGTGENVRVIKVLETHRTGSNPDINGKVDLNTELQDYNTEGVAAFIGDYGVKYAPERVTGALSSASGADHNKNSSSTIAAEVEGAVAYAKGKDGNIYMRVSGLQDGVIWVKTEIDESELIAVTSENTKNRTLLDNANRNIGKKQAESDGNIITVEFETIYVKKYTEKELSGFEALGYQIGMEGGIVSDDIIAYSHGGTPGYNGGKIEGIDAEDRKAAERLLKGYRKYLEEQEKKKGQ